MDFHDRASQKFFFPPAAGEKRESGNTPFGVNVSGMVKGSSPSPGAWGCAPTCSSPARRLRRRTKEEQEVFRGHPNTVQISAMACSNCVILAHPSKRRFSLFELYWGTPPSPGREASRLPAPSAGSKKL